MITSLLIITIGLMIMGHAPWWLIMLALLIMVGEADHGWHRHTQDALINASEDHQSP